MKKPTTIPQHINLVYDWKDFDKGVTEFSGVLIVLGGDAEVIGDYLVYNSTKLTDDQKKTPFKYKGIYVLDLVNSSVDEISSRFETVFEELGYTIKEDPFYDGSDTYGFNIVKI